MGLIKWPNFPNYSRYKSSIINPRELISWTRITEKLQKNLIWNIYLLLSSREDKQKRWNFLFFFFFEETMGKQGCEEGPGICSVILTLFSVILVIATLPFSLLFVVKVVQVSFKGLYQWIREAIKIKNCRKNGIGIIRLGGSEKILNIHHLQMMKKHVRSLRVTLLSLNPMSDGGGVDCTIPWQYGLLCNREWLFW